MSLVTADAIILQAFAYGETSKILRLLTSTHGIQSVIAKGARTPRSRFGGVLEPFTEGVVSYYARESRELHTLSGFELTRSRQALGGHLTRFGGASLLAEILLRATAESSHLDLFARFVEALQRIETASVASVEATVIAETWSLIGQLGYAPELEHCIDCARAIGTAEDITFDYTAGGIRCANCAPGTPGRDLPSHARAALRAFVRGEASIPRRTEGHWWLLARYLDHHVLEGAQLRSLAFLAVALAEPPCVD